MVDVLRHATGYDWIVTYSGAGLHTLPRSTEHRGAALITSGRSQSTEVHHIERRVDLDASSDEFPRGWLPSVYVRASGYILLVMMAVVICYSATL